MTNTSTVPDGFRYASDLIDDERERELVALVEDVEFREVRFRGNTALRTVRHLGYNYDYTSHEVSKTDPLPDELIRLRADAAAFAQIDPERLVECLLTRYPPGAGIGWHRDAPAFGSNVVGVSLLASCTLRFRRTTKAHGTEQAKFVVEPRSAYVLSGAARWSWQHSIPPVNDLRYSITFRTLREPKGD